ncbi:hypothetical protein CIPAW_07G120000 [Carya illinoinensis]|uniref:No apical meristem-associated C-terminal domain-containing protein n=1 Tax=Carya illinoinensis TaxID=32201 RepID=A0A8T1Q266_CARIL|nr:hypothetical protein CIPAW_07G120000 [Carya illinoinensis]
MTTTACGDMENCRSFPQWLNPQLDPTYGGQCGSFPMTLGDSLPLPPNEPIGVRKSVRGANFTSEKDNLNAVQKTDKKHSQIWKKNFEYFQQYKETTNELKSKWHDRFDKAKVMYQSLEKCSFQFEHCWHLLKDQPKWIWRTTKEDLKRRKTISSSPTPTQCSAAIEDLRSHELKRKSFIALRPRRWSMTRRKRKKLRLEDERLRLEAEKMKIEVAKEQSKICQEDKRMRLEAEKVELAKKESNQHIMMMDVSVMPEMQRLYFQQLQMEIMMRSGHARDLN